MGKIAKKLIGGTIGGQLLKQASPKKKVDNSAQLAANEKAAAARAKATDDAAIKANQDTAALLKAQANDSEQDPLKKKKPAAVGLSTQLGIS